MDQPRTNGNSDSVDRHVQGLSGGPAKQYAPGSPDIVHWAEALNSSENEIREVDMEFQMHRTKAAILDRVRQAVKEMPGSHSVTLTPPWYHPDVFTPDPDPSRRPTMHWFIYVPHFLKLDGVYLAMPICPRLERFAQEKIVNPEAVLPSYRADQGSSQEAFAVARGEEAAELRAAATRALVYFKSSGNIELVKKYANDPYTDSGPHGRPPRRIVRDAARWLLSGWGVEIPAVALGG